MPEQRKPRRRGDGALFLPELVEPVAGVWEIHQTEIQQAAVNTEGRVAYIPKARTEAEEKARKHELGHVKHSPSPRQPYGGWAETLKRVETLVEERLPEGQLPDPRAVLKISKMLEENRIDWILWDRYGEDIRGAREVLDWSLMPDPDNLLSALGTCLQLAWTVWGSRGFGIPVPNIPPPRDPDPVVGEYFDKCWKYLITENPPLSEAMIRACIKMYTEPTDPIRDTCAAELAVFFPLVVEEEPEQPPPNEEEQKRREEEDRKEREEEAREEEAETGAGAEVKLLAPGVELHDHIVNVRRRTMRITQKKSPIALGVNLRYPHRYLLDKAVFSHRLLNEAGIMIDGSGSMNWTPADMALVMEALPAVRVGIYYGLGSAFNSGMLGSEVNPRYVYARVCVIARDGRFARYEKPDQGYNGGNCADLEALQLLAKWPGKKLWLSDGMVCGGVHIGPSRQHASIGEYVNWGKLHDAVDAVMLRHDILRVPDKETLHALLKKKRVTLYRSSRPGFDTRHGQGRWPKTAVPMPVQYQL